MSELEWLGLEVVFQEMFRISPGQARVLVAMCRRPGRWMRSHEVSRHAGRLRLTFPSQGSGKVIIHRLRTGSPAISYLVNGLLERSDDSGFGVKIENGFYGYRMDKQTADMLLAAAHRFVTGVEEIAA